MQCGRKLGILSFDRRCTKSLHVFRTFSVDKRSKHTALKGLQQQNHPASSLWSSFLPCGPGVLHLLLSHCSVTSGDSRGSDESEWYLQVSLSASVTLKTEFSVCIGNKTNFSFVREGPLSISESPSFIKLWIQCSHCYTAWVFTEDRRDGLQPTQGERHKGREGHASYSSLLLYLMVWRRLH